MTHRPIASRPESVGLSPARLQRLDDHFCAKYLDTGLLCGVQTLVYRRGRVAHFSTLGLADRERGAPLREDTLFRIYSMTKPLTSVLFMMLVEEGKVALDEPVHLYIPQWRDLGVYVGGEAGAFRIRPPDRPMRIVDLLRHTSGLTYGLQESTPVDAAYRELGLGVLGGKPARLQPSMAALAALPLEFSPGDRWNYSISTDVLGYLVALIEGRPFEQVMRDRLLRPLGMDDTDFQVAPADAGRLAACYVLDAQGRPLLQDDPAVSDYLAPPVFVSGGGGLVSTCTDYLRFCRMMLNGGELDGVRYLSPKTIALMTANHLPGGADLTQMSISLFSESAYAGVGFGLGFAVVLDPAKTLLPASRGEYSWGGAAGTYFWIDPVEEMAVIFMIQLMSSRALPIRRDLRTLVYASIEDADG